MKSDSKIHLLSREVINMISAGEVVERPASAIKELVENSLDASATSITVEIEASGKNLIRVADNGVGMSEADLEMSCLRHSTSKLRGIQDLDGIRTLGFRGEALSSIAAVSQMDIKSATEMNGKGMYVYLESGQILRKRPAGRACGTTIEVRNLFYNVPARKKFMKKDSSELSEIARVMGRFVIAEDNVEFKLLQGDRTLIHAPKHLSRFERIKLILGEDIARMLMEVKSCYGNSGISGFISRPAATRKDKRFQMFYINGRYVRNKVLVDALYSAYRGILERGHHPVCVIFLEIPTENVDVNVHPTKLQVKFKDEKAIRDDLARAVGGSFEALKIGEGENRHVKVSQDALPGGSERLVFEQTPSVQNQFTYEYESPLEKRAGNDQVRSGRKERSALYQLGNCYIVSLLTGKIVITDQHAAHERIYFELFSKASREKTLESQNLVFPVRIELSVEDSVLMGQLSDSLKKLGFLVEGFGERSFLVQAVPAFLKKGDAGSIINGIIDEIKKRDLKKEDMLEEIIKIASCKAAVKSGDILTVEEMSSLLGELSSCQLPFTCPHGRPVQIELTLDELEKKFRRK